MALRRDQLRLVYQPIVDLRDGRILAVEALLRWDHPQRGVVGPNITVPLAERTGLILDIGEWVLRQSCQDHQRWARRYGPSAVSQVAVNVSARQVMGPAFAATVARVLTETGSDPASVFLEVTESLFLDDPDRAAAVLHEVKDLGVGLSLDDFGVGYSSLNYLRRFPFDVIKIDRSFIGALGGEFAARSIVASVIELAHALHLTSVAEGAETRDQYRKVIDLGSDRAQGYHLSHPLSAIDLEQQLFQSAAGSPVRLPNAQR
ncbi:MAG: EAL domain-containing protein [Frankiaceae bacterium]